jgi:hypothetical protein
MSLLVQTSTLPGALEVVDTDDPLALRVMESTAPGALRVRQSTRPGALRVRGLLDADAKAFIELTGATDRQAINAFVRGVKALGIWNNMVCWPLRSSQNAGSGTTAFSLGGLGTFNGTLVNLPMWGANGVNLDATNKHITTGNTLGVSGGAARSLFFCGTPNSATKTASVINGWGGGTANAAYLMTERTAINQDVGGSMWGSPNISLNLIKTINTPLAFGFSTSTNNTDSMLAYGNGAALNNSEATGTFNTAGNFSIGHPSNLSVNYIHAFDAAFNSALSAVQLEVLYNLYKTTLGQGLGLP